MFSRFVAIYLIPLFLKAVFPWGIFFVKAFWLGDSIIQKAEKRAGKSVIENDRTKNCSQFNKSHAAQLITVVAPPLVAVFTIWLAHSEFFRVIAPREQSGGKVGSLCV